MIRDWMRLSVLGCILLLGACTSAPPLELQHDESIIKAVMQDLYFASAALKNIEEDKKDSLQSLYKLQIEKIHQVKLSAVEKDISILQKHPEEYLRIHAEVRDSITMMEKRISNPSN